MSLLYQELLTRWWWTFCKLCSICKRKHTSVSPVFGHFIQDIWASHIQNLLLWWDAVASQRPDRQYPYRSTGWPNGEKPGTKKASSRGGLVVTWVLVCAYTRTQQQARSHSFKDKSDQIARTGCYKHRAHSTISLLIGWWAAVIQQFHPSLLSWF